jgi:hypothetical protein
MAINQTSNYPGRKASPEWSEGSRKRFELGDNARGALIMAAGALLLMGFAFGGMVLLASPGGWVSKAASSAVSGEGSGLLVPVSFADAN